MILKQNLAKRKKVIVQIWGSSEQKFRSGNTSKAITLYETNPDEVFDVIDAALKEAAE